MINRSLDHGGSRESLRQHEYELLARIARRYYLEDRTQEELAREFSLSRPKIQRLLDRARRTGVVSIHVETPRWLKPELEDQLRETFHLLDAIVSPGRSGTLGQRDAVAQSAARYLEHHLRDGDIVAVSHGRTTGTVPRFFRPATAINVTFVSAMGGSPTTDVPTNPNEICRALAEQCGGRAESLYAPAYVETEAIRNDLLAQEAVSYTLKRAARATVALVGIGGTDEGCTMVRSGCLTTNEIAWLRNNGAVGDVLGNYVDLGGQPVNSPHQQRLVALSIDHLRDIDNVVAVASEPEKPMAILGILRAQVIDVLVVDEDNARAVLAAAQRSPLPETTRPSHRLPDREVSAEVRPHRRPSRTTAASVTTKSRRRSLAAPAGQAT